MTTARVVLTQLYDLAYHIRPPEFFQQYSAIPTRGQNPLRTAVKIVARNLLHDRVGSAHSGMDSTSKDLCDKYLANPRSWGLLMPGEFTLRKPTSLKLERAWELLNARIGPGAQDVKLAEIIPTLLNPPYGFDYNTATLLLCAWIGHCRAELRLSVKGRLLSGLDELEIQVETARTPRDFLNWVCTAPVTITRSSPDAIQKEVQEIISRVNRQEQFSQSEAQEACRKLAKFAGLDNQPIDIRQRAARTAETLEKALLEAQQYDDKAEEIWEHLTSESDISRLLELRAELTRLPLSSLVRVTQRVPSEIVERLDQKLGWALEKKQRQVKELVDTSQVGSLRQELSKLKKQLEKQGLRSHADTIATIQDALEDRATYLKAREQEAFIRKEIEAMDSRASLAQLRAYLSRLQEIKAVTPELTRDRDNKLRDIQSEIQKLEGYAQKIVEDVQQLQLEGPRISQTRDEILLRRSRYEGEEVQDRLDQARSYLDSLQTFLDELEHVKRYPDSPQDVQAIQDKLTQIAQRYSQTLSALHLGQLDQIRKEVAAREQQAQQAAVRWLEGCEDELNRGGSLNNLKHKLDNPLAFLPAEQQPRLEALRADLQDRLDQDHIAKIEMLFRELGTPEKRQECLERLQRLAIEEA